MAHDGAFGMSPGSYQGMNSKPEVSVVMSVYNGASDLSATMDSILSQEEVDFEFIVVNDGSTDESGQILNDYAKHDARLQIIHQKNTGLTRALIRGCDVARGEFIARQDAGDVSLPDRLKNQIAVIREHEGCVLVSCWTDVVGPKGEFLYTSRGTGLASNPVNILSPQAEWGVIDGPTHHSSVMFRAKQYALCGGYRREFYFGQDWDLWYRLASLGSFCTLQKTLYLCRFALGSISSSWKNEQTKFAQLSRNAMLMRESGASDESVLVEARQLLASLKRQATRHDKSAANYFIGKCLLKNRNEAAVGYLMSAIKEDPLHLQAWISLARWFLSIGKNQAV
jgi:glycosyltransferase involved in cell wall biosynthesis